VIDWLRQRSRPYLFSNSWPLHRLGHHQGDRHAGRRPRPACQPQENSAYFRDPDERRRLHLAGADHAIIPVMLGDAKLAAEMASRMLAAGIYVVGFSFPVVPKGQARIRTQMSAAHTREQLDKAIDAFIRIGRELGVI
jgi:glycine C-acetyltransferase